MVFSQKRPAIPSYSEYSIAQLRMMVREVENILGREVPAEDWASL
jgi:hypothetical protein